MERRENGHVGKRDGEALSQIFIYLFISTVVAFAASDENGGRGLKLLFYFHGGTKHLNGSFCGDVPESPQMKVTSLMQHVVDCC